MPHTGYRRNWTIALALIVLIPCLVGIWYVDHRRGIDLRALQTEQAWVAYDAAIDSCQRGNLIRSHNAEQDAAIKALARLTAIFLDSSVDLRAELGQERAAREAADLRDAVKAIAGALEDSPQVRCSDVVRKPPLPRPS